MRSVPEPPSKPTTMTEVVSDEVRVLLARRRMTASDLAPWLGISTQAISKKMRAETAWSVADLDALAFFFDVDAATLLPGLGGDMNRLPSYRLPRLEDDERLTQNQASRSADGVVRPLGLEPRTRWFRVFPGQRQAPAAEVIPLARARAARSATAAMCTATDDALTLAAQR